MSAFLLLAVAVSAAPLGDEGRLKSFVKDVPRLKTEAAAKVRAATGLAADVAALSVTVGALADEDVSLTLGAEGKVTFGPAVLVFGLSNVGDVTTHELVHSALRRAYLKNLPPGVPRARFNTDVPSWFDEGLAVYVAGQTEMDLLTGLGGMMLAAERPFDAVTAFTRGAPAPQLGHEQYGAAGAVIARMETLGPGTVTRVVKAVAEGKDVERAFRGVTGRPLGPWLESAGASLRASWEKELGAYVAPLQGAFAEMRARRPRAALERLGPLKGKDLPPAARWPVLWIEAQALAALEPKAAVPAFEKLLAPGTRELIASPALNVVFYAESLRAAGRGAEALELDRLITRYYPAKGPRNREFYRRLREAVKATP